MWVQKTLLSLENLTRYQEDLFAILLPFLLNFSRCMFRQETYLVVGALMHLPRSPRTSKDEDACIGLWISTLKCSSHWEDDSTNLAVWKVLLKTHHILQAYWRGFDSPTADLCDVSLAQFCFGE